MMNIHCPDISLYHWTFKSEPKIIWIPSNLLYSSDGTIYQTIQWGFY
jgi:hypothetical protein